MITKSIMKSVSKKLETIQYTSVHFLAGVILFEV